MPLILFLFAFVSFAYADDKTLVVILGETRAHELTYTNIKENLIDPLHADVALCIGVREDYDYENPFYKAAKYTFLYPEPQDYASAFDYAYEEILKENPHSTNPFPWRSFLKVKNQFLGGIKDPFDEHPGSAGILLFFRWFLLKNIIEQNLLEEYDYFIITRSDYIYTLPHPIAVLAPDCIYIPDGEQYEGVTDRHVVLPKKFVTRYLNMINNMIIKGEDYYNKMLPHTTWNLEQFIKFHLKENGIWDHVRFFPYIMYTVRPIGGSTRWAYGFFSEQHNCYIKYKTEFDTAHRHKENFEKSGLSLDDFYKIELQNHQ